MFAYVAAICVLTAVLFGLAPALHVSKTNHSDVLKEGGRGSTGSRRVRWFSGAMVVAELALTIVLLAGAGLMVRSFVTLYAVDLGIDIDHLMTMRLQLPETKYANAGGPPRVLRAARAAARRHPRRRGRRGDDRRAAARRRRAAAGDRRPVQRPSRARVRRDRHDQRRGSSTWSVCRSSAAGAFTTRDGAPGAETVIINERLAAQFFPGRGSDRTAPPLHAAQPGARHSPRTSGARSSASARRFGTARRRIST